MNIELLFERAYTGFIRLLEPVIRRVIIAPVILEVVAGRIWPYDG